MTTAPSFTPSRPVVPTPLSEADAKVASVAAHKDAWPKVSLADRIAFLRKCLDGVAAEGEAWVATGCAIKGIPAGDGLAGEEWVAGPCTTARNLRLLIEALRQGGHPPPAQLRTHANGQTVARVFPMTMQDRALFTGFKAEVWMEKGKPASQGRIYRAPPGPGKVALVLGGGNVSSIPPMDALYKLFVENEVVVLKMNPVNESIGPHLERAFASLIDAGFLTLVYGGAEIGAHLANHPQVDTLHVTGSDRTYDAIVWGTDPSERVRRKAANDPVNKRPFTAELGCVTPMLIVPGPWSEADMDFQARQVASMVAQNASFNCNAAKVLVTARGWLQRKTFLEKVDRALAAARPRVAYYPGAAERYRGFLDAYPSARVVGAEGLDAVPWTVVPDVPAKKGEYALTNEAFCGVLAEVTLGDDESHDVDPAKFLRDAVAFANESCWGSLSCGLFVHPATARDHAKALDEAIATLRYGGIGVNCWPAMVYALVTTTWGAFPGHPPEDIKSGVGVVHNAMLFDSPEKSVVYAPFRIRPTPAWFHDHKNLPELGRRLLAYEREPTWGKVFGLARAALRG